jgi:hypothetical protein
MNPVQNPFAPGAGTQPKELAARGPLHSSLIAKGMIYSSSHGDNGFTGPLFDGFLKRQLAQP